MKKILITGANGYLGAQISQHLASEGHQITALCFPQAPADPKWCHLMHEVLVGSVAEDSTINILEQRNFDVIIHLVSLDHHQSQTASSEEVMKINVKPCLALLDAFSRKGLKTFLFFSTVHVYGAFPSEIIDENHSLNPENVYALTHSMSEQICDYYHRTTGVNCLTVRLSNSYGPPVFPENNCWWLAVNDLCRNAYYNHHIPLLSDGSPQRDFIQGSDVCLAVSSLLDHAPKDTIHNKYHISSAHTYTLLELAGYVREVYYERYGTLLPVSTPTQTNVMDFEIFSETSRYTIDSSALSRLGFRPRCDIREGIRSLFRYFENQSSHA
jgi:nucleoside-diphosphate-sugar epimerase